MPRAYQQFKTMDDELRTHKDKARFWFWVAIYSLAVNVIFFVKFL